MSGKEREALEPTESEIEAAVDAYDETINSDDHWRAESIVRAVLSAAHSRGLRDAALEELPGRGLKPLVEVFDESSAAREDTERPDDMPRTAREMMDRIQPGGDKNEPD